MKTLIVGMGEVGIALHQVLDDYAPLTLDINETPFTDTFEILHICFPYYETFIEDVRVYQERYQPKFTVIHSTVPVGTSRRCKAIHSPIRGIHPRLRDGIKTFVKLIGGEQASDIADYFRRVGLRVMLFDKSESTELAKLLETESYRVNIEFCHRAKQLADEYSVPFHEAYTLQAQTYNEGYVALGHPEYQRPILQPITGPIGGHCVIPNQFLLKYADKA